MHAYLVVGSSKKEIESQVSEIIEKHKARRIPFILEKIKDVHELISQTKFLQKELFAYVIDDIDRASTESANAFLKLIEENNKALFILTTRNEDSVLQTIVSRCQVIHTVSASSNERDDEIETFIKGSVGYQLSIIDRIKKREDAKAFVEKILTSFHLSIASGESGEDVIKKAKQAQQTLTALSKNGNVTIQLTWMVVSWNETEYFIE